MPGRPQWPDEHNRTQCVMVRLTPIEYAAVLEAVEGTEMTVTEFVRTMGTASLDLPERVKLRQATATAGAATP